MRSASQRAADRRYRQTERGRQKHAEQQARYMLKSGKRALKAKRDSAYVAEHRVYLREYWRRYNRRRRHGEPYGVSFHEYRKRYWGNILQRRHGELEGRLFLWRDIEGKLREEVIEKKALHRVPREARERARQELLQSEQEGVPAVPRKKATGRSQAHHRLSRVPS